MDHIIIVLIVLCLVLVIISNVLTIVSHCLWQWAADLETPNVVDYHQPESKPLLRMRVSAYCPGECCCNQYADGYTASGEPITANGGKFVAAPDRFPFGMLVRVPGYANDQPVPVLDRGGAIRENRLDVFFADDPKSGKTGHELAIEWGVQMLEVTICE